MLSSRTLYLIVSVLLISSGCLAFSPPLPHHQPKTLLSQSTTSTLATDASTPSTTNAPSSTLSKDHQRRTFPSEKVAWMDLPKSAKSEQQAELADSVELIVGRVAMVAAVFLLCNEVLTGDSFFDQLIHAVVHS